MFFHFNIRLLNLIPLEVWGDTIYKSHLKGLVMTTRVHCYSFMEKITKMIIVGVSLVSLQADELSLSALADDANVKWGACPAFLGKGCEMAVIHGDPAKPNSDIFFKVPENFKIPLHWHTSAERMVLVKGKMDVTYHKENTNTLSEGEYAYGPAKKVHKAYCHKGSECVLFIAFEEPIDAHEVK